MKLYGANKHKENTVTKSKQRDIKYVTLMAEKVIKPLISMFLRNDYEITVKALRQTNANYVRKLLKAWGSEMTYNKKA